MSHNWLIPLTNVEKFSSKIDKIETVVKFLKEVSPRLNLFDQKYSKNSNIVKYYYNFK